ncbi:MAG: hypothetical protein AB7S44_03220 [Spirochaetales bacterium]
MKSIISGEKIYTRVKDTIQSRILLRKNNLEKQEFRADKEEYKQILEDRAVNLINKNGKWQIIPPEQIEKYEDTYRILNISAHNYFKGYHNGVFLRLPISVKLAILQWNEDDLAARDGIKAGKVLPSRVRKLDEIINLDPIFVSHYLVDYNALKKETLAYVISANLERNHNYHAEMYKINKKVNSEEPLTSYEKLIYVNMFNPPYNEALDLKYENHEKFTEAEEREYIKIYFSPMKQMERRIFNNLFGNLEYAQELIEVSDVYYEPFKEGVLAQHKFADELFDKYYKGYTLEQFYEEQLKELGLNKMTDIELMAAVEGAEDEQAIF